MNEDRLWESRVEVFVSLLCGAVVLLALSLVGLKGAVDRLEHRVDEIGGTKP